LNFEFDFFGSNNVYKGYREIKLYIFYIFNYGGNDIVDDQAPCREKDVRSPQNTSKLFWLKREIRIQLPILSRDSLKYKIKGHKRGREKQKSTIFERREELVIIKRGRSKTGLNRIDMKTLTFCNFLCCFDES